MAQGGKRKAAKRAAKKAVRLDPLLALPAAGVTFCVIAWGYLVSAAIDFGSQAREGESQAWIYLGIACLGAAACLFAGLMMGAHVLSGLGVTGGARSGAAQSSAAQSGAGPAGGARADESRADGNHVNGAHVNGARHEAAPPPRVPGGRRAKR